MAGAPSFGIILGAQSLSAVAEVFGQRATRHLHKRSTLRSLLAVTIYGGVQALIVVALIGWFGPTSYTQGQGVWWLLSMGMWHWQVWLNAITNVVYWAVMIVVLREPIGVVLVVLAFVIASVLIRPFQLLAGLDASAPLGLTAFALAVLGSILCVVELPHEWLNSFSAVLRPALPPSMRGLLPVLPVEPRHPAPHSHTVAPSTPGLELEAAAAAPGEPMESPSTAAVRHSGGSDESQHLLASPDSVGGSPIGRFEDAEAAAGMVGGAAVVGGAGVVAPGAPEAVHWGRTLAAFAVLGLTAGIGIVLTDMMEEQLGFTGIAYAGTDQVPMVFLIVPTVWLACQWPWLRRALSEPEDDSFALEAGGAWSLGLVAWQAWQEVEWVTLVPFRALLFIREFLFFYLVTAFPNMADTYLEMTLVRVVLCWLCTLVVCATALRQWSGIGGAEAGAALHPVHLALRVVGSLVLVGAGMLISG